ncbi:unnamed protein product, partial [Dicrocoelium dendriticum]
REPAVTDSVGRILVPESPDLWRERFGLALALSRLPEVLTPCDTAYHELRRGLYLSDADDAEHIPNEQEDGNTCLTDTGPDRPASAADTWIIDMFRFLVPDGLNDRNAAVRSRLLQTGLRAVAICGKSHFGQLLPILELFLNKAPNVAELDAVRQSVLILTASLSQHLAADDPKVWNIFSRLLTTLSFPSDVVRMGCVCVCIRFYCTCGDL